MSPPRAEARGLKEPVAGRVPSEGSEESPALPSARGAPAVLGAPWLMAALQARPRSSDAFSPSASVALLSWEDPHCVPVHPTPL